MPRERSTTLRDRWWLPTWRVASVLLLLGLIVNLGVAVAIARWGVPPNERTPKWFDPTCWSGLGLESCWELRVDVPPRWPGPVPTEWTDSPWKLHDESRARAVSEGVRALNYSTPERSLSVASGWITRETIVFPAYPIYTYRVHEIGFPLGTLRYDMHRVDTWRNVSFSAMRTPLGTVYDGVGLTADWGVEVYNPDWVLPLVPVWTGVVMNSALYATLWWLAWIPCQALRRRLRLGPGECVKCRYPLVPGKDVCPECGTSAPPSDQRVVNRAPAASAQYALTNPTSEHAP